jgi:hypothetical protein
MSFNEQDRVSAQLHGRGWRRLAPPQTVRCYVGSTWMDAPATEVNDQTREVRIEYPVVMRGLRHFILDASQYRPSNGLFQREEVAPSRPAEQQ